MVPGTHSARCNVRLSSELMTVALWTVGFVFAGGFVGFVTAVVCEETGLVRYSFYVDSLNAGFQSLLVGAGAGGLLGFAWSVRRWYRRAFPVVEIEQEL